MLTTYSAYKLDPATNTLSCRENLNDRDEVNEWLARKQWDHVVVFQDSTGKAKQGIRVDDLAWYEWKAWSK